MIKHNLHAFLLAFALAAALPAAADGGQHAAHKAADEAEAGVHTVFHLHWQECRFVEGTSTLRVTQGDPVTLHLHADTEVELHLHGYDDAITVPAGGETLHRFTADIPGRFPVAIHTGCGGDDHGHRTAFYLEVMPK